MSNANNYPVDVFPAVLRDVITALHEDTQMPIEMIGSTVLAALSLALQPLIEVSSPFGSNKVEPCSLYFLTLAKSGEGKSPLRDRIMAPFDEFVLQMQKEYEDLHDVYKEDYAIWASIEKALNRSLQKASKDGEDSEEEEMRLREHLSTKPEKPRAFEMFYEDTTSAGIVQGLREYPYAGVFSDEAILFFTGHLKNNLGLINKIWKNEPVSLTRKKEGSIRLNAYLTFLLMVQPEIFDEYLEKNGKRAVSSGFLARFLFTNTMSTIGQRNVNLNQEKSDRALDVLFEQFNALLERQKIRFYDDSLPKETLTLTDNAKNLFKDKVNQFQFNIGKNQPWEHIPEFVSKANNQAIRIAALFSYPAKDDISESTLNDAFTITAWHLNQACTYFYTLSEQYQLQQDVYMLFDWIKRRFANPIGSIKFVNQQTGQPQEIKLQPWQPFLKNEIEMYGPAKLRKVGKLTPVLNQLIGLGLIVTIVYPPSKATHISMVSYDNFGNFSAVNAPYFCNIINHRSSVEPVLNNYDSTKLHWQ